MADAIKVLFYLALLGSISVYAWRAYRHFVHHETRKDREEARRAAREATSGLGPPPDPTEPVREGSLVEQVIREELARKNQPAADASAATGAAIPAPAAGPPPPTPDAAMGSLFGLDRTPTGPPVADLVAGIQMPCDLAPMVTGDEIDPHHVIFVTTGHDAGEVGRAMATELERLGFTLRPVAETEIVGTRTADAPGSSPSATAGSLRVRIVPDAAATDAEGVRRFPHAPGGSVAVELIAESSAPPR